MLIDTLKDAEKKAGVTAPPEPAPFTAADEEVMATFIARLRQSWEEALQQKGTKPAHCLDVGKESITSAQDRRSIVVIPAKAGIQDPRRLRLPLDPRFPRGVTIPRCKHGLSSRSQALKQ